MASAAMPKLRPETALDDLVAAARSGGRLAFEQLYRLHIGRVHALCLRLSGDADHAEQLAQDAFVKAWRNLPGYRAESSFATWLHRLTVNVVLDWQRTSSRRRQHETRLDPDTDLPAQAAAATVPGAPVGLRLDLEHALSTLPEGARTAFVLHEIEGYPVREVAALLQVTEGTVKTQLFRARRQLREVLR